MTATQTDYDAAEEINRQHLLAMQASDDLIEAAIRCGELLIEQKRRCGHGHFQAWVKEHCLFSHDSANCYMLCAKRKNESARFSSIRELVQRERAGRKAAKIEYAHLKRTRPEPAPGWHNAEERAHFIAVGNWLGHLASEVRKHDALAVFSGALESDISTLRRVLSPIRKFLTELDGQASRVGMGLPPVSPDDRQQLWVNREWSPDEVSPPPAPATSAPADGRQRDRKVAAA